MLHEYIAYPARTPDIYDNHHYMLQCCCQGISLQMTYNASSLTVGIASSIKRTDESMEYAQIQLEVLLGQAMEGLALCCTCMG